MKKQISSNGLTKVQVLIMAIASGVCVANVYYNQPILKDIASSFQVSEGEAGSISVLSQVGYGFGLFFLIPLGDKINKKTLILSLLICLFCLLIFMTVSQNIVQVWILSVAIGITTVSAQIILPLAASIDRVTTGQTVGNIFTGILIGVLGARVFSGYIAEYLSWRYVYGFSAVMILIVTVLLKIYLPNVNNEYSGNYFDLLKSTIQQLKRFSLLREASLIGGLMFGVFCSFWTTLTFHLSGAPFNFQSDTIGMYGFVAIAGALMAPIFGKLADKGNSQRSLTISVCLVIASLLIAKIASSSALAIAVAVLLLDVGVQAIQVTNVARIYTLDAQSNSRINTVYMTTYFIGGAVGTSIGLLCWHFGGWNLVTWQMLVFTLLAFIVIVRPKITTASINK
ncbi:MFS transporter [Nostoc sp. 'Lobaria pulmonaria (5183) cyanobiont']|uniref:MFS transporter n=1 Tax=Nostoc sp. 'Lobaria pulmonaria (5183) cyanobiont' TaxID=1618022 RepID=UPI000CF35F05|nr:MFS transporter [Nostoc sp. 'Lobaria pulmonaria (5183) cyanobiont']AVH70997.1 major facilitator superfamily transporter [Nostoc sp. 'Lobaria pulmonaria (5183) cyanobiont']